MAGSRSPLPMLGSSRYGRQWVRSTEGTILSNTPDGWVSNQGGPAWFLSSDASVQPPDWPRYGYRRYITSRAGVTQYGNRPVDANQLAGAGILPSIRRATNLIVGPVVGTSWRYFKAAGTDFLDVRQGEEMQGRPLWTIDPQLVGSLPGGDQGRPTLPRPKRVSGHAWWETLLTHALWWGKGAVLYVPAADGSPLAGTLRIVNPARWGWTDDGRFVLDPDGDNPLESDEDGAFDVGPVQWRMRLLDGWAPVDEETPSGVLPSSGLIVTAGERMNSYLAGVLGSGVPAGVLKVSTPDFDQTKADALKSRWMQAHGGTKRSVAVLNAGIDFSPLQMNLVDADLVRAKGTWLVDLAHAFGLSASYLDAATGTGGNITYANLGERRRDHLDHTLAIPGRRLEDFVTSLLPYGTAMRVDWTGYLSTDGRQQLEFVDKGLAGGWLSKAEGRDRVGLRPHAGVTDEIEKPKPVPPQLQQGNREQDEQDQNDQGGTA